MKIDYDKLAGFAGMGNPRSASNAWAKIKTKLLTNSDGTTLSTPKKGGAKKKVAQDENGEEVDTPPKKSARKRPAKNQVIDGDASPKKKGCRGNKIVNDESGQCYTHCVPMPILLTRP